MLSLSLAASELQGLSGFGVGTSFRVVSVFLCGMWLGLYKYGLAVTAHHL